MLKSWNSKRPNAKKAQCNTISALAKTSCKKTLENSRCCDIAIYKTDSTFYSPTRAADIQISKSLISRPKCDSYDEYDTLWQLG